MATSGKTSSGELLPLAGAWLVLVVLSLLGLYLGQWFHGAPWLQPLVAGNVWFKGVLVARRFIEVGEAHPFIRRVVYSFVAFAPLALVLIAYFGDSLARWTARWTGG